MNRSRPEPSKPAPTPLHRPVSGKVRPALFARTADIARRYWRGGIRPIHILAALHASEDPDVRSVLGEAGVFEGAIREQLGPEIDDPPASCEHAHEFTMIVSFAMRVANARGLRRAEPFDVLVALALLQPDETRPLLADRGLTTDILLARAKVSARSAAALRKRAERARVDPSAAGDSFGRWFEGDDAPDPILGVHPGGVIISASCARVIDRAQEGAALRGSEEVSLVDLGFAIAETRSDEAPLIDDEERTAFLTALEPLRAESDTGTGDERPEVTRLSPAARGIGMSAAFSAAQGGRAAVEPLDLLHALRMSSGDPVTAAVREHIRPPRADRAPSATSGSTDGLRILPLEPKWGRKKEPKKRRPLPVRFLFSVTRIYLLLCVILFVGQRWLLYPRDTSAASLPAASANHLVREVTLTTEDGLDLTAWFHPGSPRALAVLFPGNGGNRAMRYEFAQMIRNQGCSVLQVEYRGYGGNPGRPSEEGLYRDGEAALEWARAKIDAEEAALGTRPALVLVGESLGTGVAVEMATRHAPDGLVIHAGYTSIPDVAEAQLLGLPIGWLGRDRFESEEKIGRVTCPKLFFHGREDRVIPMRIGDALYIEAARPKRWVAIDDAGHDDLWVADMSRYFAQLRLFLEEVAGE